ncbi:hypothetical protein S40285_04266 [Stachybotrys chlorohalonatus IBT 40285]|uniref:Kynurenine formamidase n=1 Tax=Stachybotrys chlorohalonatus (strain IBT 40285) TaxID=1283841 RepID=A0A084QUA0_STAC4|nr:hypothetical protein S40285_04266 [Stachybotrys chlorohalonata IBT 40285]
MADIPGLHFTCHQYGEHRLQRVGVWQFAPSQQNASGQWIIYIHGGAWRDPRILLETFAPSIKHILSSKDKIPLSTVRGFMSIDYRLSPHPDFPQDPVAVPKSEIRSACHPDHVEDVLAAVRFLSEEYQLGSDYILIGHSAGATLAYQLFMGKDALAVNAPGLASPRVIIGVSGIYDLVDIDERHGGNYGGFISCAFGDDKTCWQRVSPRRFPGTFRDNFTGTHLSLLAWSPEDSLIDEPEIDGMAAKLREDGVTALVVKDLTGEHDFVWEDGSQIARLLALALQNLQVK